MTPTTRAGRALLAAHYRMPATTDDQYAAGMARMSAAIRAIEDEARAQRGERWVEVKRLTRERDEARAEVARLREVLRQIEALAAVSPPPNSDQTADPSPADALAVSPQSPTVHDAHRWGCEP